MNNTFTENDLLLFIYGEADAALESQIKNELLVNKKLQNQHRNLLSVTNQLDSVKFEPNATSLKIIMEQSALQQREEIY
jgi:hypothetical protein